MALEIETIQHNDYLEVVVSGPYDFNDAVNKFPYVLDLCRITGLKKVLIDFRKISNEGGGTEKTLYALSVEDFYQKYLNSGGHELQFAYVGPSISSYEPGMEIAQQSELPFKLFDKRNEALEWLNVKTS
jgi:hypothetical protein